MEGVGKNVSRFQPQAMRCSASARAHTPSTSVLWRTSSRPNLRTSPSSRRQWSLSGLGSTALQALRDHGKVRQGQEVLIIGASGGVGPTPCRSPRRSAPGHRRVQHQEGGDGSVIGADPVIDYTREDFAEGDRRYDLIVDIGGTSSLARLRRALAPEGPSSSQEGRGEDGGSGAPIARSGRCCYRRSSARTGHVRGLGEPRGPASPKGAHRIREDHAAHRQDVPARRGPGGHPIFGRRTRPRKQHDESRHGHNVLLPPASPRTGPALPARTRHSPPSGAGPAATTSPTSSSTLPAP